MRNITLPVSNPKKTIDDDLLKNAIPKPLPAGTTRPSTIKAVAGGITGASTRGTGTVLTGSETDAGTNGVTPKLNDMQQRDAAVVAKLSPDFPIQTWDSMSYKAQLQAMKFSGLTEQEQWQLLNPSAPLSVLDAANRERIHAVASAGVDKSTEILTNPSKTPYLQNGQSEGQLGNGQGFAGGATPKEKTVRRNGALMPISNYPAIAQLVDVDHITPEQGTVLAKAQIKLTALGMKREPTQQEIDDILADACTKMLTDENRPVNDKGDTQSYVPAYTDAINDFLLRLRVEGETKAAELKQKVAGHKNILNLPDSYARHEAEVYIQNFILDNLEKGVLNLRDMGTWNDLITDYSPDAYALNGSQYLFVYNGMVLSVEDLGNIAYGYRGSAMGISRFALLAGGDVAGIVKDILSGSRKVSKDSVYTIGDDQRDKASIELGIQLYKDGK